MPATTRGRTGCGIREPRSPARVVVASGVAVAPGAGAVSFGFARRAKHVQEAQTVEGIPDVELAAYLRGVAAGYRQRESARQVETEWTRHATHPVRGAGNGAGPRRSREGPPVVPAAHDLLPLRRTLHWLGRRCWQRPSAASASTSWWRRFRARKVR